MTVTSPLNNETYNDPVTHKKKKKKNDRYIGIPFTYISYSQAILVLSA